MATRTSNKAKPKIKPALVKTEDIIIDNLEPVLEEHENPSRFPIVGIGASAGGLAAFEEFFSGMPKDKDIDMAFILVQHLAPNHESLLTEIIKRYTRMQVFEVTEGMTVTPNCVYVIPPNRDMAFLNGSLQLFKRSSLRGNNLPIDFFFRSLADDLHERSICIILSGTGSDGTSGLRHIKAEGGLVIVQTPETTDYDGMTVSAISTGLVDYTLPPRDMAKQLISYTFHVHSLLKNSKLTTSLNEANPIQKVFVLLRTQTGNDFSKYKPSTINRRIERRLAVHQIETMENYVKFLQQTPSEIDALFYDLLIGVTSFFRDKEAFAFLETDIIPKLFKGKPTGSEVRLWCTGCSTGEEAYSLAILIQEHLNKLNSNFEVKIFATDIDNRAISIARKGAYSRGVEADLTPERLSKFFKFEPGAGLYQINKTIRDMLIFSEQNVIKDPPFSKIDLISCRNLMIYLNSDLQKRIIPLFHYSLNPNGILFLGSSETIGENDHLYVALDRKLNVYQRKNDLLGKERETLNLVLPKRIEMELQKIISVTKEKSIPKHSFREITEQSILKESSVAGILVNGQGDILFLHGRTGMYLEPTPGEATVNNIIKMAREGLKHDLSEGLHKVAVDKETVRLRDIIVKTNGHFTKVNLVIKQVMLDHTPTTEIPLYIVLLEEAQLQETTHKSKTKMDVSTKDTNVQLEELKIELRIKEEYLRDANENLESANEELTSTNEELQSVNEELQSTNEELETSKEELQSINEELSTVNCELQTKIHDLSQANNDMNNLLSGTNIATLFLDLEQNIFRFTPTAIRIFNLISSDLGRPLTHIVSNLVSYNQLSIDVNSVLDTLITKTTIVQTIEGRWYTMVIQPYRTIENVIEGVVLTFIDVTEERIVQKKLSVSELSYRALFETTRDGILILDGTTAKIQDVNPYLTELLGYSKKELLEKEVWDIGFFKDIVSSKENFIELKKQKFIRYNNLPLETASGKKIEVEFISNVYEIDNIKIVQCNIRKTL
jgi:two-component system, chemotaxis family, CheB/CheR fusion protein